MIPCHDAIVEDPDFFGMNVAALGFFRKLNELLSPTAPQIPPDIVAKFIPIFQLAPILRSYGFSVLLMPLMQLDKLFDRTITTIPIKSIVASQEKRTVSSRLSRLRCRKPP